MEHEPNNIESGFDAIESFAQLFEYINTQRLGFAYKNAYEEAATIAKDLVATTAKDTWNAEQFRESFTVQHPELSPRFIEALTRCVQRYNPPVNIPSEPLWE
jgi:hypothetical protein